MVSFIALLRGINVGGRNILPMRELEELLRELGCRAVRTYIQSGNVVLQSDADPTELAVAITGQIAAQRGFEPRVLLLRKSELLAAVEGNPFPEGTSDPKSLHLGFLESEPERPDIEGLEGIRAASERFELRGRVFYLHAPDGIGRSQLAAKSEKLLGVPMTMRNWRTVDKILGLFQGLD